ncbi:hypothetical protein APHNP_1334 [Anaplasma phagocytophilum str. ApNP]|uniref:Uncharacterized protein n=2 Tax=Anaplasma phagocytophilum TaxID=948 RepID=A0A0F3NFU5_ANAPH|nr:hypothetical protein APHMUC_1501 [Anaplasma phagocytophilum str. ApMUC09]KJV66958.1 hypothetical protein APHNP_1334 [Anaplasma phagocytophilum str. ApNP]SCV65351.1 hypothetical protein ANAPH1_00795 [Anaplasma phagocytophilum]
MKIPTVTYAAIKLWHQAQEVSYVPVVYCYGLLMNVKFISRIEENYGVSMST